RLHRARLRPTEGRSSGDDRRTTPLACPSRRPAPPTGHDPLTADKQRPGASGGIFLRSRGALSPNGRLSSERWRRCVTRDRRPSLRPPPSDEGGRNLRLTPSPSDRGPVGGGGLAT